MINLPEIFLAELGIERTTPVPAVRHATGPDSMVRSYMHGKYGKNEPDDFIIKLWLK